MNEINSKCGKNVSRFLAHEPGCFMFHHCPRRFSMYTTYFTVLVYICIRLYSTSTTPLCIIFQWYMWGRTGGGGPGVRGAGVGVLLTKNGRGKNVNFGRGYPNKKGKKGAGVGRKKSAGHDDVIKWKHFPRYWPFVRGIHRCPVNSPHKGQSRGALMFTLICARING